MFRWVRCVRSSWLFSDYRFAQLELHSKLQTPLKSLGFERLTQVQANSFTSVSNLKDVVLSSETGSGKTLAYLLPIMSGVLFEGRGRALGRGSPCVIVLPSAELCAQVLSVIRRFVGSDHSLVSCQMLTGTRHTIDDNGVILAPRIRWGMVDVVVCTPSMFAADIERFRSEKLYPSRVVFDEADLLFHGSDSAHMDMILRYLRPRHAPGAGTNIPSGGAQASTTPTVCTRTGIPTQCIFSSATFSHVGPNSIGSMLFRRFPNAVCIQTENFHAIPVGLKTEWIGDSGDWESRCLALSELLPQYTKNRILVFVNSKSNGKILHTFLGEAGFISNLFIRHQSGGVNKLDVDSPICVCTDLAARGIDWENIDLVVNFQMPTDAVAWIHRAGRTGRMGSDGKVISFYKHSEAPFVNKLRAAADVGNLATVFSNKRSLGRKSRSLVA